IFLCPRSRNFAVVGDKGVHEKCGEAFWKELASAMTGFFRKGDFTAGVVHGVERAGALLAEHFPRAAASGGSGPQNSPNDTFEAID
ncbi:MAG: TPM domain-containing protein, partial [Opitutaceae bacterium]